MAAAEYFNSGPLNGQNPQMLQPPTYPQQMSSNSNNSSPQFRPQQGNLAPPPPYSAFGEQQQQSRPGVHFAPQPTQIPQRHSFSGSQRPSIAGRTSGSPSPNYHHSTTMNNMSMQTQQQGYYTPPKNQQLTPHMRPYAQHNASSYSLESGGYSSDPEPHRHRRKHHSRRDHSGERSRDARDHSSKKSSRSTNNDALLGAAAGGLIGDLIFPGLGTTLVGAGVGWLGGKDYGNHRKWREEKRDREQRDWEDKFRHDDRRRDHHGRSRSRSGGSGGSGGGGDHREPPPFLGQREKPQSYERRSSNY